MKDSSIFNQLFELEPKKSQKTQVEIAEAAIKVYMRLGISQASYADVAKESGFSRTIICRYFPTSEDLLLFVAKYIRSNYQQFVIKRFSKAADSEEQLKAYLKGALDWVDAFSEHSKVWMLFFYYCGIRKEFKKLNTELVQMGFERLKGLVSQVNKELTPKNVEFIARQIHLMLSGSIMASITEETDFNSKIYADTINFSLNLVRLSSQQITSLQEPYRVGQNYT